MRLSKFDQFLNFRKAKELVFEFFDLISFQMIFQVLRIIDEFCNFGMKNKLKLKIDLNIIIR